MEKKQSIFIATSLDGYIADLNGGIEWLDTFPEINTVDTGYNSFMENIDALVMGKNTFEKICSFDIEWPYPKPVYVVSSTLKKIPEALEGKVKIVSGSLQSILKVLHAQNQMRLYIDGGKLIQSFLDEDLIDEMIITVIPVLIGSGIPLFNTLKRPINFKCIKTSLYFDTVVQNHYVRSKSN